MKQKQSLTSEHNPGKWLGSRLGERSQRAFASELNCSRSQLNRWISSKEVIPVHYFLRAAQSLGDQAFAEAKEVLAIDALSAKLPSLVRKVIRDDNGSSERVISSLISIVKNASDYQENNNIDYLLQFSKNLSIASNVVSRCLNFESQFISQENIQNHLLYPFNTMTGYILKSDLIDKSTDEKVSVKLLRRISKSAQIKPDGFRNTYVQQHAFYLLGRFGGGNGIDIVNQMLSRQNDVATRRTVHYTRILANNNPQSAENFIYDLSQNKLLSNHNLEFDFIHYGDMIFKESNQPNNFSNTLKNYLKNISSKQQSAIVEIAYFKLINLLHLYGHKIFDTNSRRAKIMDALVRIQNLDSVKRTMMEQTFLLQFGNLDLFSPAKAHQMFLNL